MIETQHIQYEIMCHNLGTWHNRFQVKCTTVSKWNWHDQAPKWGCHNCPQVRQSQFVGNKAKGQILKRVFQENKARQIFQKMYISYTLICTRTCAYQGVRNIRFSETMTYFVFLKHPFWDLPFCLITDELLPSDTSTIVPKWHWIIVKN